MAAGTLTWSTWSQSRSSYESDSLSVTAAYAMIPWPTAGRQRRAPGLLLTRPTAGLGRRGPGCGPLAGIDHCRVIQWHVMITHDYAYAWSSQPAAVAEPPSLPKFNFGTASPTRCANYTSANPGVHIEHIENHRSIFCILNILFDILCILRSKQDS